MQVSYQPWLVVLSVVIAIQGAYVGFGLAVQIGEAAGARRRLLLAGAAFSFAVAIWTMHFVGMLAARLPFPVDYLVFPTLLSFLVCVIVVGIAVFAISAGELTPLRLTLSAALMGTGIFSMHYIGMFALHDSAIMVHAPFYVIASLLIAVVAAALALWLSAEPGAKPPLVRSATAFGIAVSGMHYTAMAGMTLYPYSRGASAAPALSPDLLAIVVAIVAFCVSGIFLLFLVPDPGRARKDIADKDITDDTPPPSPVTTTETEARRGAYAPLGGAGAPPVRLARHLPVEHDGATHFIAVDEVVAVHANAHYTYVFNGAAKLFCPLAISEVEARLDKARFLRVHRSHIVNIECVTAIRRAGDSEIVELSGDAHYAVPVSRSRAGWLKSRVGVGNKIDAGKSDGHASPQAKSQRPQGDRPQHARVRAAT
jgi:NO-binding membrane sensor protein with MHYT domain